MWRKQTHTVCFHNLLEDHLRPSAEAGLQCNRDRKPGPRTKPRTETGLPPGRARFPRKVRLLWKYMTFDSVDTLSAFPALECAPPKRLQARARARLLRTTTCFISAEAPREEIPLAERAFGDLQSCCNFEKSGCDRRRREGRVQLVPGGTGIEFTMKLRNKLEQTHRSVQQTRLIKPNICWVSP